MKTQFVYRPRNSPKQLHSFGNHSGQSEMIPSSSHIPGQICSQRRTSFDNVASLFSHLHISRTTRLDAPVERLEDHNGEILTCEFHPNGELLLSAGISHKIHISSVYGRTNKLMVLEGHRSSILEAHFSVDGLKIISCSSDQTVGVWDTFTGSRINLLRGHMGCVNTVHRTRSEPMIVCSGGDDATVRIWDVRQASESMMTLKNDYNTTAMCFDQTGGYIFAGDLQADIKVWDIRMPSVVLKLHGHQDAVTGVALSPCGTNLLSHSVDSTLRVWNIQPSFPDERCIRVFHSNQQFVNGNLLRCKWSPDGSSVSAGSCEEGVPIWSMTPGELPFELPGHEMNVNDVDFHPTDPIIASAGSDSYLFLHELKN